MLKHVCFANEKMKAEKHDSIKTRKNKSFSAYLGFFCFFINEKHVKSASAVEGGGGEIKFSAEIMANRATWAKC